MPEHGLHASRRELRWAERASQSVRRYGVEFRACRCPRLASVAVFLIAEYCNLDNDVSMVRHEALQDFYDLL